MGSDKPFSVHATELIPDLAYWAAQATASSYARYAYRELSTGGRLVRYRRTANGRRLPSGSTTSPTRRSRLLPQAYGTRSPRTTSSTTSTACCTRPEYRETYAADLKKMLPRIPLVRGPMAVRRGRPQAVELHLGYESAAAVPGLVEQIERRQRRGPPYDFFRVTEDGVRRRYAAGEARRPVHDHLQQPHRADRHPRGGVPLQLGSRSAIEWIIDRYQVKTDKARGIVNDPNDWSEVRSPLHRRPARPDRDGQPGDDEDRRCAAPARHHRVTRVPAAN